MPRRHTFHVLRVTFFLATSHATDSCVEEVARSMPEPVLPSLGRQLMQVNVGSVSNSAVVDEFRQHLRSPTMTPLSWRSIRDFPALPTKRPGACGNIGWHFPELVSRNRTVLDEYEHYACQTAASRFTVDPALPLTAQLSVLEGGCINTSPRPTLRLAANRTHAEFLYRSCDEACRSDAIWDRLEARVVDEDLLVIPSLWTPPRMEYQHALLDFLPQVWTALDLVKNTSTKILTHHPLHVALLQSLGIDAASILQMPLLATALDRPQILVCTKPGRPMHIWRVAHAGQSLPTLAYGDSRIDADLWHRLINYQVGPELSNAIAAHDVQNETPRLTPRLPRVVFLQRCESARHIRNEQEALARTSRVLIGSNRSDELLSICPGRMQFLDQVREMRSAWLVIAEHGGAMANLLFAEPGTGVIELVGSPEAHAHATGYWPPYKSYWYGGAAAAFQFYKAVIYEADAAGEWQIRLEDLEEAIRQWIAQERPVKS